MAGSYAQRLCLQSLVEVVQPCPKQARLVTTDANTTPLARTSSQLAHIVFQTTAY